MPSDERQTEVPPQPELNAKNRDSGSSGTVQRLVLWSCALAAGLTAGLAGGGGGELTYHVVKPVIKLPADFAKLGPYDKSNAIAEANRNASARSELANTAIAYGVLGGVLGGTLGLAGGIARRSVRGGLAAAVVGVLAGATAGSGMSAVLTPVFYRLLNPETNPLIAPFVTHAGIFAAIGVAGGIALGMGRGGLGAIALAAFGGFLGALVGATMFEVGNALFYPLVRVVEPIPGERLARLAAHVTVALFAAAGAVIALRESRRVDAPKAR